MARQLSAQLFHTLILVKMTYHCPVWSGHIIAIVIADEGGVSNGPLPFYKPVLSNYGNDSLHEAPSYDYLHV
jgi:hypothetical protein